MEGNAPRQFKTEVYSQLARIGSALSSGPRIELLELLSQAPSTVEHLARQVGQSVANTSHHLQALRRARLVDARRDGVFIEYRLADDQVADLIRSLRLIAEARLLELDSVVRAFHDEHGGGVPVDRDRLLARVRDGEVTVLDVRPAVEFRAGHLLGAVSVPLDELEDRLAGISKQREVVAYCRGRYCMMARDAARVLTAHGYRAAVLDEGIADMRARGLAIAVER